MREILRASSVDFGLQRVTGLEWQDDVADIVSNLITQGSSVENAVTEGINDGQRYAQEGRNGLLHVRWAAQDGIARGVIAKRRSVTLLDVSSLFKKNAGNKPSPPPPKAD